MPKGNGGSGRAPAALVGASLACARAPSARLRPADRRLARVRAPRDGGRRACRPASLWVFLVWWLAMSLSATAVVSLVYALSRRLLPLGALLELSLVFPDESPSRFKLALRTGTVESLEERLRLTARGQRGGERAGGGGDPAPAGRRARRPRQDHARPRRARSRLLLQPRQAAQPGGRRSRPSELGRAPPRRRQARGQRGDPEQARQADRRGMGAAAPPSPVRRDARRAAQRMARRRGPTRSDTTTSTGTARATRAASRARRSRSPVVSSRSPMSTT